MVIREYNYFEAKENIKVCSDEIEVAWRKIKMIWHGSEDIEIDIPAFEEMESAIKKLIRIEKSWKSVNEASCRSSMDEYGDDR